jgi:transcription initiation factor TFIID TATA-box-binding protein
MAEIKIENIVASVTLGVELNLLAINKVIENAQYEPGQFPGLVYRLTNPKAAALIFRSGKVVCTGAKSEKDIDVTVNSVVSKIKEAGIKITKKPIIEIQNIVASADLKVDLNLNEIAMSIGLEKIEYEPEQFPGLVYRLDDPKVVVLLFGSGKLVCTGARKPDEASRAVDTIVSELSEVGLLPN